MKPRVRVGLAIVICTYAATEMSILLGCSPFHRNWQIYPDPGSELNPAVRMQKPVLTACSRFLPACHLPYRSVCDGGVERHL